MVTDGSPSDVSRPRGIFGRRDREYLLDELDVEPQTQRDREIRSDIRERMWNGMLDMVLLYEHVEHRDIEQVFDVEPGSNNSIRRRVALQAALALIWDVTEDMGPRSDDMESILESAIQASRERPPSPQEDLVWLGQVRVLLAVSEPRSVDFNEVVGKLNTIITRLNEEYGSLDTLLNEEDDPAAAVGIDSITYDEMMILLYRFTTEDLYEDDIVIFLNQVLMIWANSRPIFEYTTSQLDDLEEQLRGE